MELDRHKSEESPFLEFLVCLVSLRGHVGDMIASLTLSKEKIRKLVKLAEQPGAQGQALLAVLQKLAGKLFFSQTAAIYALQKVAGEICSGSIGAYLRAKLRGGGSFPTGTEELLEMAGSGFAIHRPTFDNRLHPPRCPCPDQNLFWPERRRTVS